MAPVRKRPTPRSDRPKLAEQPSAELSEQPRDPAKHKRAERTGSAGGRAEQARAEVTEGPSSERKVVMDTGASGTAAELIAGACTLPTVEQPLRGAEFAQLFASAVSDVRRRDPTHLILQIDSSAEARARDLTNREQECCSFFHFTFAPAPDVSSLWLNVAVPEAYVAVLDAIEERARSAIPASGRPSAPASES
jgi:hypothetical protein